MSEPLTMEGFAAFYSTYHTAIERHLWRMVHDRDLAADLAQETFTRALVAVQSGTSATVPRAWIYRIATNCAIDALRHRKVIAWMPFSALASASDAEDEIGFPDTGIEAQFVDTLVVRETIAGVLAQLTPEERHCLALEARYPQPVCARYLGISLNAYKMRLSRARSRFAALWHREQGVAA
jgi:RNA polymerase sigma-70 factor, ECF subfamily